MVVVITVSTCVLVALMALETWVLARLRDQQRRLQQRLDALQARLATAPAPAIRAPELTPVPAFDLRALDGARITRESLTGAAMPTILVFTDPRCGPCYELLPDLGGWQRVYGDRLSFALVSTGAATANRAMTAEYGIAAGTVVLQDERELASAFDIAMAPAAVLIPPGGQLATVPVYGAPAVRTLVANALGLAVPAPPLRAGRPLRRGELAPPIRRPDLAGSPVNLAAAGGQQTLLLFWSPGCHHCASLLPEMKQWEASARGPRLLVVSRGPVALNLDAGLTSPVVLDDDHSLASAFGVTGTPAAVLIDARGAIATDVARGERAVRDLAARWWTTAMNGARA